jgi:dihydropyrimidinase
MQGFDTIIHGGTLVTAADSMCCDVGIRDGRIAALRHDLGAAALEVDPARNFGAQVPDRPS